MPRPNDCRTDTNCAIAAYSCICNDVIDTGGIAGSFHRWRPRTWKTTVPWARPRPVGIPQQFARSGPRRLRFALDRLLHARRCDAAAPTLRST